MRNIDYNIAQLEEEKIKLSIEWTYLTTPEKLKELYKEIGEKYKGSYNMKSFVSQKQIQDYSDLNNYYFAKSKYDNNNPVLSKK